MVSGANCSAPRTTAIGSRRSWSIASNLIPAQSTLRLPLNIPTNCTSDFSSSQCLPASLGCLHPARSPGGGRPAELRKRTGWRAIGPPSHIPAWATYAIYLEYMRTIGPPRFIPAWATSPIAICISGIHASHCLGHPPYNQLAKIFVTSVTYFLQPEYFKLPV